MEYSCFCTYIFVMLLIVDDGDDGNDGDRVMMMVMMGMRIEMVVIVMVMIVTRAWMGSNNIQKFTGRLSPNFDKYCMTKENNKETLE